MPKSTDEKIDALAHAMGEGFKEVGKRFDGVEARLDGVEGRLDGVEGQLRATEHKVDLTRADIANLHFDYRKMLSRIENLELKTFGSVQE